MKDKRKKLDQLRQKMASDKNLPLRETATNLVFGEGSTDPKVYFLGEAPGRKEDETGKPFIGQAGKFLDTLLKGIGLNRADVYITSILRYRPPNNRDPKPSEIEAFKPYIDEEIRIIQPKIIATLGRHSLNKFLPGAKISQIHGQMQEIEWDGRKIIIFPLYHPAAALRIQSLRAVLASDFKKLSDLVKKH
jgi:uracil-DNA glycosylase